MGVQWSGRSLRFRERAISGGDVPRSCFKDVLFRVQCSVMDIVGLFECLESVREFYRD